MDAFLKRKIGYNGGNSLKKTKKEICPHSEGCYRRNPHHFREYEHPHLNKFIQMGDYLIIPDGLPQSRDVYIEQIKILKPIIQKKNNLKNTSKEKSPPVSKPATPMASSSNGAGPSSSTKVSNKGKMTIYNPKGDAHTEQNDMNNCKPGTMLEKLRTAAPYNVFFTTIIKAPATLTQPNAIKFTDLLCPSLGELKCSLQINFMIDIMWLLEQYKAQNVSSKPLTIIYGDEWPDMPEYIDKFCPNVTHKFIRMKDPFGCHHSKIGLYIYEDDSIRVVVSSANLYYEDWNHYNQALWLSPSCPKLPNSSVDTEGESPTGFKSNLLNYLKNYNLPCLKSFIDYVRRADFSDVRVFLVYSVPGKHYPNNMRSHLHTVADLLSRHCILPAKTTAPTEGPLAWGIIAQASSLGSMGKTPADWLRSSFLRSLSSHKQCRMPMNSNATLNIVYPSVDNVMRGYFGPESGGCLPYSKATNEKQRWLQDYLHQWKADAYGRTKAMPHIKSYCRVSPCLTKLAYFLLTSANISKSAWGSGFGKDLGVYVRSYEVGVMFLPAFFNEEYFEIKESPNNNNKQLFPFMYDLPLIPYMSDDYPWCN